MKHVRIFLKTELYAIGGTLRVVPDGISIVDGQVRDDESGGFMVDVTVWRRSNGDAVPGPVARLFLPLSKIDYMLDIS